MESNENLQVDLSSDQGFIPVNYSDPSRYIQIGCDYYLCTNVPDARGHMMPALIPWRRSQLIRDFRSNPDEMTLIPRYIGMGSYPSHVNYQQEVCGYFNTYCRLGWKMIPGEWPNIQKVIKHVFGDQVEFGLDYFQLLYFRPAQILPILVLVSRQRQTGKTTFLNLLKEIFGPNMAFVTNETLRSKFNSERASRLIIACDETFLNKKEDSERLKALSTAQKTYIEFKGKDRYEVDNFVKIILCSNNVNDPIYIDREEVRYWVREVPTLTDDNPNILMAMKREIPAFLFYLSHRTLSVPIARSRMWFTPKQIHTPTLARIIRKCRPTTEIELAEVLLDIMDLYSLERIEYTTSDLTQVLKTMGHDIRDAHKVICKQWDVPRATNKNAYDLYAPWVEHPPQRYYGRYYTFTRKYLETLVPNFDDA